MIRWLILAMVYLGSLLMVYNIYGFVRFARYVKKLDSWKANNKILYLPIVLLVCFLLGYLAVGIFGKPDLIVAGILFGGSIFVFVMYKLLSNITQRIVESERLEAQLRAAEESSRAKSDFLASMSHEVRTPLNAVIGLNRLALQDDTLQPRTRERLEQVDASAHHLLDMVNDVLDMNHIASGHMQLKAEPFSPADVVNLVNVLARMLCEEKGVDYRYESVGEMESACIGDALRLRQVLLSLLTNAAKFTPQGGSVRFVAEQLPREGENCVLRFTVSDTGVGIDEAFMPRLFDAFSQEDASATNHYGGSGLGLAITKRLVNMMDGDIAVESGAEDSDALETAKDSPAAIAGLGGRRVLVADDMAENAEIVSDLLELEGMDCDTAGTGLEALRMMEQSDEGYYDAILMDLRMPVMDGLEATRRIRALDRADAKAVPIIALTANTFDSDIQSSLEAGMNAHLVKPVDADALYAALDHWINRTQERGTQL